MLRALGLALLIFHAVASAAQAGVVEGRQRSFVSDAEGKVGPFTTTFFEVTFTAEAGETNDLVVTVDESRRGVRIRDAAAPLRAGEGCQAADAHEVVCASKVLLGQILLGLGDRDDHARTAGSVTVEAGEGADRVEATGSGVVRGGDGDDTIVGDGPMDGGPGNDTLTAVGAGGLRLDGGPGSDRLNGGAGAETLDGGGGTDVIRGGAGDDKLTDGDGQRLKVLPTTPGPVVPIDADVIDGDEGRDEISYAGHTVGVRVDLRFPESAGQPGEGDRLEDIETVLGGLGDDVLIGTDGTDELNGGGGGADLLVGGGGSDTLEGGDGADRLVGGADDDALRGDDGADQMAGEAGNDILRGGEGSDRLNGGDGDDEISGGPGGDRIIAGRGNDLAVPGENVDHVALGPGSDVADLTADFVADRLDCGTGGDTAQVNPGESTSRCERRAVLAFGPILLEDRPGGRYRLGVRAGVIDVTVDCLDQLSRSCGGSVAVADRFGVLARGRFGCVTPPETFRPVECQGPTGDPAPRLSARGRRALRVRGSLDVVVTVVIAPGSGGRGLPVRVPARLRLDSR